MSNDAFMHKCPYEGVRSPGARVSDSCELPCECWELSPGSLFQREKQPVLLTTESSC